MPSARAGQGTSSATTPAIFRPNRDGKNVQGGFFCVLEINIASWLGKVGHLQDCTTRPSRCSWQPRGWSLSPSPREQRCRWVCEAAISRGSVSPLPCTESRWSPLRTARPFPRSSRALEALDVHDLHPKIKVKVGETGSPNFSRCELSRQLCEKKKIGWWTTDGVWFT
jgi:hypothetical protein